MAKRQETKKKKSTFSGFLMKLAVLAAVAYLVVTFVSGQLQVAAKQRELDEVTARVELQAEQNRELQQLMDSGDEQAYIERMAREKLRYARPQDRIFVDLTGE